MVNPYNQFAEYRRRLKRFEKLYLETNHKLAQSEKLYLETNHQLAQFKEAFETQFETGHFYSPYPDMKDINKRRAKLFNRSKRDIPGIDINEKGQLSLLKDLAKFYKDLPYKPAKQAGWRYFFDNDAYSYTDAIILFCMLRQYRPKRVIEIGSGYSSALMMDVNENFLSNKTNITFIEPYPKLLLSLMKKTDKRSYKLLAKNLSDVSNKVFESLGRGDILFIDSTHVSKAGSDVNQIFFEVLPLLKKGVIIHIHDIFYPFEYPYEWIKETRAWNEDYLVRAFLHNNKDYRILLFNHFLNMHHADSLKKLLPLTAKNPGGSLWLEKV